MVSISTRGIGAAPAQATFNWGGVDRAGGPDWDQLLQLQAPVLSAEEQAFMDHEVRQLCGLVDDWEAAQGRYRWITSRRT